MIKSLVEKDYQAAAELLSCEVAVIKAVSEVEADGDGFLPSGEPDILFEAHIFSRFTGHKYDLTHPGISSKKWNRTLYVGGQGEHRRLAKAVELDRKAALEATSWGMFQLMGFNWHKCGFKTLQSFINAMYRDERSQLIAFCNYVRTASLADELQRKDWVGFAYGYNGDEYYKNNYDVKLEKAYARHKL